MPLKFSMPFTRMKTTKSEETSTELVVVEKTSKEDIKKTQALLKLVSLAIGYDAGSTLYVKGQTFESSPYDFERIGRAFNADSYVKNAFAKYRELFWKEGWDIVGENPEAVDYLWQRIDYLEEVMQKPFHKFIGEVFDQYIRYANVFVAKVRNDLNSVYPSTLIPQGKEFPVVGYEVLPTENIEIKRNKHNVPQRYKQAWDDHTSFTNRTREPTWAADEVIHLYYDREPGHAFGTPFVVPALDDVVSLRQIEDDVLNLIHRELFPLYKFTIGTEDQPAEPGEVEKAIVEIEGMRTESALVLPYRYNVEIIGSEGKSLDAAPYLTNFKERVSLGLGVFPHHLGMSSGAGNRSVTDRLDVMLYDRIKFFQRDFAELIRFFFFNEWLREGGFDPMTNPKIKGESDRCYFKFKEIDVDTQIKKETHSMAKMTGGMQTIPESRMEVGRDGEMDDSETLTAMQVRLQPTVTTVPGKKTATGGTTEPKIVDTTPSAALKGKSSTGGTPNLKNVKKGAGNIIRPTNQHGTRTSPNVRHDDDYFDILNECAGIIDKDINETEE